MDFTVSNHRLLMDGKPVDYQQSPNHGGVIKPRFLIIHYTAGLKAAGAIKHFLNKAAEVSAHLVIDRDPEATVTQMVPFNVKAWHAGQSKWDSSKPPASMLNGSSIGIEIVNAGKLEKNEAGQWLTWSKHVLPPDEVTVATHKHESRATGWHEYTIKQIEVTLAIAIALHEVYQFEDILGHDDISLIGKVDPGPLFNMQSFKAKVLARKTPGDEN